MSNIQKYNLVIYILVVISIIVNSGQLLAIALVSMFFKPIFFNGAGVFQSDDSYKE